MKCPNCGLEIKIQAELPLGPIEISDPAKFSKNKLDVEIGKSLKSTNRFDYSANKGEAVTDSIRLILGDEELCLNGPLWIWRCTTPIHREAIQYAVFKWNRLTEVEKRSVKNPAAWITSFYKRGLPPLAKASKSG
jgi:hypothetical protein